MVELKRLNAPRFWNLPKKAFKLTVTPRAGPHKKDYCIPLLIVVRNLLKLADTGTEAHTIITRGEILVDGRIVKDHKYPAGIMDAISVPRIKKFYRVVAIPSGLGVIEISEKESKMKICKISDKTLVKKGKTQLNLHDGKNVVVDKDAYKTNDSLVLELPGLKIIDHIKLEPGTTGMIVRGKNSGNFVKIKEVVKTRTREPNEIICDADGKEIEAIVDDMIVVGKEKPAVKLSE